MKSIRLMLPIFLITLSTVAFAQSDAQKSFDTLKALAGDTAGLSVVLLRERERDAPPPAASHQPLAAQRSWLDRQCDGPDHQGKPDQSYEKAHDVAPVSGAVIARLS